MQKNVNNLLKFYLVEINPADYKNESDKLDFLGSYANPNSKVKLLRSTNKVKINELLKALKSSICWEKPIFNDSHLPYYAITAYLQDKISREQASHILEFHELKSTYPDVITIPILTRGGSFTHASGEYFSLVISCQRSNLPNVTAEHLEKFRLSLLDYRKKSASSFYVLHLLPSHGLGDRHVGISSLLGSMDSCEMGDIFMPGSVRNIFYPAITPKNSTTTTSTGKLGKFSIDDVEKGHRENVRLHALGFPGTFRTTRAHGYNITLADATGHDAIHQGAISYFPEHLYHMSLHCVDVIRDKTKIKWSEELWLLIDMYVIDPSISVLNQKTDPNTHSVARTYSINEALSYSQCRQWMARLLKHTLSDTLLNIILHDMIINKSVWQQWIDVDNFVKSNITNQFNKPVQKPLTIYELLNETNIIQQIIFGYISGWQSITDSALGKLVHFGKNSNNRIELYLFGEPIVDYSNHELKSLLTDIAQNNSAGIELINSAASGDLALVKKRLESVTATNFFDYILIALRMAAKFGRDNCVEHILKNRNINNTSPYYCHGLEDAASSGHINCVRFLLDNIDDSLAGQTIQSALLLSIKRNKTEVVDLLLSQNKYKISRLTLVSAIRMALDHDASLIANKLFAYASKKNKIQRLIQDTSIYKMLRSSPINCISVIMDAFIGHSDLTYHELFKAIAKSGSVECANEFITSLNKQYEGDNVKRNNLLMECMLEGFSSVSPGCYFTQPFNLHHEMVKLQIDQYLKSSAFNNFLLTQNQCPKNDDIERLVNKIFSLSFKKNEITLYTLCDIGIHYLIRHPMIRENKDLYDYYLSITINKALHHQEQYYLRLLLRSGVALNFSKVENESAINGILIKNIPFPGVRCLVWLTCALDEIQKLKPNDLIVRQCLQNAGLDKSFKGEIYSLAYSNSAQINIHTLRRLVRYLSEDERFAKATQLITERIELLESDWQAIDQFSLAMFNKASANLHPVITVNSSDKCQLSMIN
ncbi:MULTISPECIES: ankyrin repeat domain-containing protein [unclassified Legionella]|uniref:ankyrin repeat domain-containing protein n=1 Tax=unclassified Legionella TaxID=2622702 RepID=UPI001055975C|nr:MULTISPECIES: ankyrin repeat domain-containing protein [unclassified Legionella]MDI9819714.1 ankyrin repeat domain-containing protein [Legionella sp. PL877]